MELKLKARNITIQLKEGKETRPSDDRQLIYVKPEPDRSIYVKARKVLDIVGHLFYHLYNPRKECDEASNDYFETFTFAQDKLWFTNRAVRELYHRVIYFLMTLRGTTLDYKRYYAMNEHHRTAYISSRFVTTDREPWPGTDLAKSFEDEANDL